VLIRTELEPSFMFGIETRILGFWKTKPKVGTLIKIIIIYILEFEPNVLCKSK
jgi:hypothetical protein